MPRYIRSRVPGATVFFTVGLAERGGDLLILERDRLRAAVRETRAERPFAIDAWVFLPDHLHCVWTLPPGDRDFPTRWGAIKARFSRGLPAARRRPSHAARREKAIWQRLYCEHQIRNEAVFAAHVRYCWFNPVKHGLVGHPLDWPFSSIHRDMRAGRVEPEWAEAPEGASVACA